MLMLVSGTTATVRRYPQVGELIVPGAWTLPDTHRLTPGRWAMDNGAYSGFDAARFMGMLRAFHGRPGYRFVTAPDVVADAPATLAQWPFWSQVIRGVGFVPALVAQDGLLVEDVPWPQLGVLFIGGSTEWKLGPQAQTLAAYAKSRGLWVHVGRVNSRARLAAIAAMGADSFDGSGFSKWGEVNIPKGLQWTEDVLQQQQEQPSFDLREA